MTNMVFVFPPAMNESAFSYHLGVGHIRSYLQENNIETYQFVTSQKPTIGNILTGVFQYKPDVVGFTCYDSNYLYVRMLIRILKKKNPNLRVVVGGPTATFSYQEIMTHTPEIDICVRGEGEITTLELFQKEFEDLESIKGITYRSGNELISNLDRPLISSGVKGAELDVLPSPYLTGFIPPDGTLGILTSRGCIYHCTYCNFTIMFKHTIRYHSIDRVIEELKLIADNWDPVSLERILFYDDIFSLNVKRAKELCQRIIDEGIDLIFFVDTRADSCDKELLELMKEAGVSNINFGLESASCKVLRAIKKVPNQKEKQFLAKVKTCVQWAKEVGITPMVSTIFGMSKEGVEEAEETLNFVKELQLNLYSHNILFLYAGTELFRTRKEYGLDAYHSPTFLPYKTQHAYDVTKITPLPNATLTYELGLMKKTYCDLLSYGVERNLDNYEYLMIKKLPEDAKKFCHWLQTLCVLPFSVIDVTEGITKEEGIQQWELLLHGETPVGPYYIVLEDNEPQLSALSAHVDLYIPVPKISFQQYEGEPNALITLEQPQDVEALSQFLHTYTQDGIVFVPVKNIPEPVIGTCRWGKGLCPALSGNILVVNGDDVLPCYYGKSVGKVGDSRKTLQENSQDVLHKKETERGCQDCLVKNECSRCPFPYPLTDNEFCELKRKYPGVSHLVTVAEWLHQFSQSEDEDKTAMFQIDENSPPLFYHGKLSDEGEPLPKVRHSVEIFSLGKKIVAAITGEFKFFTLDPKLAIILEAFQLGVSKESLVSYLCEKEDDRGNALSTISNATALVRNMGFLEPDGRINSVTGGNQK